MTALTFNLNAVGTPDNEDKRAIRLVVEEENARRAELNAAEPPPDPLLEILPVNKAAYEVLFEERVAKIHNKYIKQATDQVDADNTFKTLRGPYYDATEAKRIAATQAFLAALQ